MAVEDEIWRPGYEGPPPVAGPTSFDRGESPQGSAPDDSVRRGWRMLAVAAAAGAVSLAAVLVVGSVQSGVALDGAIDLTPPIDVVDEDRLQFSPANGAGLTDGEPLRLLESPVTPFAGADPRRLPRDVLPLWTVELAPLVADGGSSATTWVEVVDGRIVVVGIGDASTLTGPAAVHVLDATTGDRLWWLQVESRIDQVEFVAAIDDVLIVTVGSEVVALDLGSGSQRWSAQLSDVGGAPELIERLEGTDLLARSGREPEDPVALIDPATGAVVGELSGEVLGTDREGRWYVLQGDELFEFDLARPSTDASDGGGSLPAIGAVLVGGVDADRSRATAVIDRTVVATIDEAMAVGPLEADGERIIGPDGLTPLTIDLGTPQRRVLVRGIIPLGGSAFATVGGGTVSGAEVIDDAIRFAWQRRGAVSATFATERGVVLLLGTDGGSAQTLVDGATGATIASLTMSPGLLDALEVTGNGIVTRRTSRDGSRIAALDLDGNEMWALDGSASLSIGDGIVLRSTPQPDGSFQVTAYGDGR